MRSAMLRRSVTEAGLPLIEVHLSNLHTRETFRHTSVISGVATGVIAGFHFDSYSLAIDFSLTSAARALPRRAAARIT